jgi:phospholipid/cholesterol/gamma-HCH transport system permease protein
LSVIGSIGRYAIQALRRGSDFLALLSVLFRARFYMAHRARRRIFYQLYNRQIYLTAVQGLPVNAVLALLLGVMLVFKLPGSASGEQLVPVFSRLFVIVVMRELAPLMCAILLLVRSGTAVTAKLGYLNIFREFDVLQGMGISPVNLFLVPVFFAFPLSMLLMVVYFHAFSLASAEFTLWLLNPHFQPLSVAWEVMAHLETNDVVITIIKCLVSGLIIGLYAIRFGAAMGGHLVDVTRSISGSATRQLVGVLTANIVISLLAYT